MGRSAHRPIIQKRKMIDLIDNWAKEIIDFTCELIATPSETPPGDERKIANVVLNKLDQLALDGGTILAKVPERPNVLYHLHGQRGAPTLLYSGHLDTKPVGDVRGKWKTNPFEPVIMNGRLYGLGSADMKGAVAAFVYALAALKSIGPLGGDLLLALVADEEAGGKFGSHYLTSHCRLKADMALVGEPPGVTREWEYLHIGSRGVCCFNIKVYGTQMHSSLSDRIPSVNASLKVAELMTRMSRQLKLDFTPHPLCPTGVTVNVGVRLEGGVTFGVYPGSAEFGTDIRTIPGMHKETVVRDLQEFLEARRREDPSLKVELELVDPPGDWIAPIEVSPDLPLVQALARASDNVLGFCPPFSVYPAATDAAKFQGEAGIPTIPAYGAGMISVAHGANEWIGVKSIIDACKIYALAAFDLLAT